MTLPRPGGKFRQNTVSEPKLSEIQAWLHTFVVEPGDTHAALRAAEGKAGFSEGSADSLILPSHSLQPIERLSIYRRMYLLRMTAALVDDFPAVQEYLGGPRFRQLAAEYVQQYPSRSFTLDHLGRHFAKFLLEFHQNEEGPWLSELAQLEWALCEIFGERDSSVLSMLDLSVVEPDDFDKILLEGIPALRLLEFEHDLYPLYKDWSSDLGISPPQKALSWLICWRQNHELWRAPLSEEKRNFLVALLQGQSLGAAIDSSLQGQNCTEDQLFEWFQTWVDDGIFSGFSLEGHS